MFSRNQRIPRNQIKKVISEGQKCHSELFLLRKLENNLNKDRFAVVVSKKVSKKAVERIILKRKIKGIIRSISYRNGIGHDFVFLLSSKIKDKKREYIFKEIKRHI